MDATARRGSPPLAGFHNYPIFAGNEYDINYTFPNGNRLDGYEGDVSRAMNRIVRHHVGKKLANDAGLHCDDAGWVHIDEFLQYEPIWRHWSRQPHIFLAPKGRSNDKSTWNMEEAKSRMALLFKIMFHCARRGRRVREQVLAFGVDADIDRTKPVCRENGIDADTKIPDDGGLILYPVAIRAPVGQMDAVNEEVFLKGTLLSHPLTATTSITLSSCFHMTGKDNLKGIWSKGLIPGGEGALTRMFTFFKSIRFMG